MQTDDERKYLMAEAGFMLRREASMRELNQRIARLARALELDLEREGAVERLILEAKKPVPPSNTESYVGPERRRKDILFFELRGLVVLRYELVSAYASQYGSQAMMLMIESVDLHATHVIPEVGAGAATPLSSN